MPALNWLTRDRNLYGAAKTEYRLLVEVPELGCLKHAAPRERK
jgi:hypothetical protein